MTKFIYKEQGRPSSQSVHPGSERDGRPTAQYRAEAPARTPSHPHGGWTRGASSGRAVWPPRALQSPLTSRLPAPLHTP